MYTGTASGPVKSVQTISGNIPLHVPPNAFAGAGGDGNVVLMDPINQLGKVFQIYQANIIVSSVTGGNLDTEDAMSSQFGEDYDAGHPEFETYPGTLTMYDLNVIKAGGPIRHALRYATDATLLKDNAVVPGQQLLKPDSWPVKDQDRQSRINVYTGNLKAGTSVGILLSTPMPAGLTKGGQECSGRSSTTRSSSATKRAAGSTSLLTKTQRTIL